MSGCRQSVWVGLAKTNRQPKEYLPGLGLFKFGRILLPARTLPLWLENYILAMKERDWNGYD